MLRIGIDLGGTKIEGIVLRGAAEVLARQRIETPGGDYPATVAAVAALVARLEREVWASGLAVGIGHPGAISPFTGLIKNANSTCLNDRPLKADLEAALGRAVRMANERSDDVSRLSDARVQLEREAGAARVLRDADRLKNALLLSLSHDLRSPVATLALLSDPQSAFRPDAAMPRVREQAERLGDKNKSRAVGAANGRNPISIIVPCHRVVGSTGKLTGFAGDAFHEHHGADRDAHEQVVAALASARYGDLINALQRWLERRAWREICSSVVARTTCRPCTASCNRTAANRRGLAWKCVSANPPMRLPSTANG